MPSTLRNIAGAAHEAPIAPDIVPADWADCVPHPANDALSREKLFAEIRSAAETAAPAVDTTFRATDVNDTPAQKRRRSSSRAWMKRIVTVFVLALVSAVATAAWKHHGDAALQTATSWVSSPDANSSAASEAPEVAEKPIETAATPPIGPAQSSPPVASADAPVPPAIQQQMQALARDLAAMGQQIEQLKASIEAMKANQNAPAETAPPIVRAPAPKPPPQPKVTALPPRPVPPPAANPPRPTNPPAMQATAASPPAPAAVAPMPYQPPPQATTQPNGEPIPRPPMPMPFSDRY